MLYTVTDSQFCTVELCNGRNKVDKFTSFSPKADVTCNELQQKQLNRTLDNSSFI